MGNCFGRLFCTEELSAPGRRVTSIPKYTISIEQRPISTIVIGKCVRICSTN